MDSINLNGYENANETLSISDNLDYKYELKKDFLEPFYPYNRRAVYLLKVTKNDELTSYCTFWDQQEVY